MDLNLQPVKLELNGHSPNMITLATEDHLDKDLG